MKANLFTILSILFISGCASNTLNVAYYSDPPGAILYQGNQRFGYAPTVLQYHVTDEDRKRGYKMLQGTSVRWTSGATASIPSLRADLSIGLNQQFTFLRPADYPGREADERFALEIEKLNAMRRQSEAQEAQAAAQLFGGLGAARPNPVKNCVSTPSGLGGSVNTTCY